MTMNAQYLNRYLLFVKAWYIQNIYGKNRILAVHIFMIEQIFICKGYLCEVITSIFYQLPIYPHASLGLTASFLPLVILSMHNLKNQNGEYNLFILKQGRISCKENPILPQ